MFLCGLHQACSHIKARSHLKVNRESSACLVGNTCMHCGPIFTKMSPRPIKHTAHGYHCSQHTQQHASEYITPMMLVIAHSGQGTQNSQLSHHKLQEQLQELAVRKSHLRFHVQNDECCSISYKQEQTSLVPSIS